MNYQLLEEYQTASNDLLTKLAQLRSRNKGFILSEILSFILAIGCVVLYTLLGGAWWILLGTVFFLLLYFFIRHIDVQNERLIKKNEALLKVYLREINYHQGEFTDFDSGSQYQDAKHFYTYDLDIFGLGSLFQRISRTISKGGSDQLAQCLAVNVTSLPKGKALEQLKSRQGSIEELATKKTFLINFMALGVDKKIDTQAIRSALNEVKEKSIPSFFSSPLCRWLRIINLVAFYFSIIATSLGYLPTLLPMWWGIFNFIISFLCSHKHLRIVSELINTVQAQVSSVVSVIKLSKEQQFHSKELVKIQKTLSSAQSSFTALEHILQKIDNRSNEIGIFLFNSFALWDILILINFRSWQHAYEQEIDSWLDALNTLDALVSMGNYKLNEPSAVRAEVVETSEVVYQGKGLYHPFLGEKAVRNDFDIKDHNYYIITGANMAGKSTFLRSLGINYILAINGLPVFANSLKISLFHLFTSMRTTDDLTHGISYFNAELLRLEQLLSSLNPTIPSLIILDEILKGTNSLDKLNGSRLFLQYVSNRNVTGVIATHDLELSKMEDEQADRFHNYCFEIDLGEHIHYSYKLTKGIARNQNATFLLRKILSN